MLKGLDPRLGAEVLAALRAMGHGDQIVLADANFPADSVARRTVLGRLLRMDNLTTPDALQAILSVLPLDTFVPDFAMRMLVVGDPGAIPEVMREAQVEIDQAEGMERPMMGLERFDFYKRAESAFAVIQTGERRFYGNVILRKGVIAPV